MTLQETKNRIECINEQRKILSEIVKVGTENVGNNPALAMANYVQQKQQELANELSSIQQDLAQQAMGEINTFFNEIGVL